jgi:hypothetical protein
MQMRNTDVDHVVKEGKDKLFKPYLTQFIFKFSLDIYLRYLLQLQPVKYDIDLGYIFEDVSTYESYRYLAYTMQVDSVKKIDGVFNKNKHKFGMIDITLAEEQRVFSREYVKLQTVAANIGGVAKFFLTASQILMFYYSKQLFISDFANSIFNSKRESNIKHLQSENKGAFKSSISGIQNNNINMDIINDINKSKNFLVDENNHIQIPDINAQDKDRKFNEGANLKNLGLFRKKLAVEDSNLIYYCKTNSSNDLIDKLKELKEERLNDSGKLYEVSIFDKFGLESRRFKILKKSVAKVLSIDNLINNITQLVHLKNYVENTNELLYFGNGIDWFQTNQEDRDVSNYGKNLSFIQPIGISKFNNNNI